MNTARLSVAAVVMAALGGFLYWSNKQEAAKAGQPAKDAPPKILAVAPDVVDQVEIKPREGAATVLKRNGQQWDLASPKKMTADFSAVTALLASVSPLNSERVVEENPSNLKSYGLDPAAATVTFTQKDGKATVLHVGDASPTGSSVYAMVDGDKRLYTMLSSSKDSIVKSFNDLREKHLLSFEQEKLSRVEFQAAGKGPMEFGRSGQNEWQILKPQPMRADGFQVEDILSKIKSVTINGDPDDKAGPTGFASAAPVATIKVTGPDGVKSIEIRKSKDDAFAKSSTVEGAYKVNKDAADGLAKSVDDFRAKKIFDFGFTDPTSISVKDGAKMLTVTKSGEKWESGGKTMDSVGVQNLIDKLRDLAAAKFVESGFTTPVIELTVVSNDGKRTEKVQISAAGDKFIAKRENDASLYQMEGSTIADLRQSIDGVREPAPSDGKKK